MKTSIVLRIAGRGVHRWPNQTLYPELAYYHPHTFVIFVELDEKHPREIEFIRLRTAVIEKINITHGHSMWFFGDMSCGEIAEEVIQMTVDTLKDIKPRRILCTVWEDDQSCGEAVDTGEFVEIESRPTRIGRTPSGSNIV